MELKWTRPQLANDDPGGGSTNKQLFEGRHSVRADIFVREDLQNRVDARHRDHTGPVRVTIRKRSLPHKLLGKYLPPSFQQGFITTELQGLTGRKKQAREKKLQEFFASRELPVLVIEDFGTTGLNGPVNSRIPVKEPGSPLCHETNALTCFLRRNGKSGKTGKSLGSAGLGRHVYYMASEVSTKFVYTVPADLWRVERNELVKLEAKPMFFGQSFQNELDEVQEGGKQIIYSGYLHLTGTQRIDEFPTPFGLLPDESDVAEQARKDFKLERRPGDKGCSVIIPFPRETLALDKLAGTIAAEFALPILAGELVVELPDVVINADTLIGLSLDDNVNEGNQFLRDALLAEPRLVLQVGPDQLDRAISASDFEPGALKQLGKDFHDGRIVCVAVQIGYQVAAESVGTLHLVARRVADGRKGRSLVARKGLILTKPSDHQYTQPQNSCILMKADAGGEMDALARMLREVETAAHDDWIVGDLSEDDCVNPRGLIERVKTAHKDLVAILTNLETEEDVSIFRDLLPSGGGDTDPPPPYPAPFSIHMQDDELRISAAAGYDGEPGGTWQILVVLDSVQGSGRSRRSFRPGSFDLKQGRIKTTGGTSKVVSPCLLETTIEDPGEFEMKISGCSFPAWADVRIQATQPTPTLEEA